MARIFIAARIPAVLAREVAQVQKVLDSRIVDVKWVEPQNMHLTLRFFGELGGERVQSVERVVSEVAGTTTPFTVRLQGIGSFPAHGRPRVIWIGMKEGSDQLVALASALDRAFISAGLGGADRPFAPHLTLGRLRDPNAGRGARKAPKVPLQAAVAMHAAIGEAAFGPEDMEMREIAVVESRLSPRGPTYADLLSARLGTTA